MEEDGFGFQSDEGNAEFGFDSAKGFQISHIPVPEASMCLLLVFYPFHEIHHRLLPQSILPLSRSGRLHDLWWSQSFLQS